MFLVLLRFTWIGLKPRTPLEEYAKRLNYKTLLKLSSLGLDDNSHVAVKKVDGRGQAAEREFEVYIIFVKNKINK